MDRLKPDGNAGWIVFLIVVICAAGIAGILGYRYLFTQDQIDQNKTALTALCAQRHDLDLRILAERALLEVNPGKLVYGIPRSLFVEGLNRDQTTRQNLEILDCKETP